MTKVQPWRTRVAIVIVMVVLTPIWVVGVGVFMAALAAYAWLDTIFEAFRGRVRW